MRGVGIQTVEIFEGQERHGGAIGCIFRSGADDEQMQMPKAEIAELDANYRKWLTAEEAARYLRVKRRTLLLWVRQGKIKGYRLSGIKRRVWRFQKADLDAALLS